MPSPLHPRLLARLATAAVAFVVAACGPYGLELQPVATSLQRPSNVAVYLAVLDSGEPITDLKAHQFRISEDGQPLDESEVGLRLLSAEVAAEHHTLLLIDLTAARSDSERRLFSQAGAAFVRRLRRTQKVAVYAFDGGPNIRAVEEFPQDAAAGGPSSLDKLEQMPNQDPSRNLNGALVDGLRQLDTLLTSATKPVRVGTLVVVTGGADLAGRTVWDQVETDLDRTRHQVIALGIRADAHTPLDRIGRAGTLRADSLGAVADAFDKAASRTLAVQRAHYLIAYCSPSRGGVRTLRVELELPGREGQPKKAAADLQFSADGFVPGCKSDDAPRFVVTLVAKDGGAVPALAPETAQAPPPEPDAGAAAAAEGDAGDAPAEETDEDGKAKKKKPSRPRAASRPAPKPAESEGDKPPPAPAKPKPKPKEEKDFEP